MTMTHEVVIAYSADVTQQSLQIAVSMLQILEPVPYMHHVINVITFSN